MNGADLLEEIKRRLLDRGCEDRVTDKTLATHLGISQPSLKSIRENQVTPRQIANLLEKTKKKAEEELIKRTIVPIIEFLKIDPTMTQSGKALQIFSTKDRDNAQHPYFHGLRQRLEQSHGIYIFHDSRGRAIYAGKAQRLSLWTELNNALNRDRGEIQNIKRVSHPSSKVIYKGPEEKTRRIVKENVSLSHVASYVSAYQVPDGLINKFEALIVRSFANDLLNVRMENF